MNQPDSSIVERYADHLKRKAASRITRWTIGCALLGSMFGSVPLVAPDRVLVPHYLGYALLLVGAAAGGYLGYTVGVRRAEGLALQAQVTLYQLQVGGTLAHPVVPVSPSSPPLSAPPEPSVPRLVEAPPAIPPALTPPVSV
jgi:hypothetical protein